MNRYFIISFIVIVCYILIMWLIFRNSCKPFPYVKKFKPFSLSYPQKDTIPKKIWLFWHKSVDESEPVIKFCYDIIRKNCSDYDIYTLDLQNYKRYVDDYQVINIMDSNKVSINHKSDLLRFYLIYKYGGIYLDSSIIILDSFEWIYKYNNKYDVIMYKNTRHTTDDDLPVPESWFIAAKPKNKFIGLVLEKTIDILSRGDLVNDLYNLKNDIEVNYQNFRGHGTYHILYYIYVYIIYKNDIDNILFLDCNPEDLTCSCLMNSSIGVDFKNLFVKPISDEKFNKIKEKRMVKLARYSRDSIRLLKNKIQKDSFIDRIK
jgi:hypothetical protein